MLCLPGVVWPCPKWSSSCILNARNGIDLHLHGGTCNPSLNTTNLTSRQPLAMKAAICHTPL